MNKQFLCVKQPSVGSCACVCEQGIAPSECDYCHFNSKAIFPLIDYSSTAPIQKHNHILEQREDIEKRLTSLHTTESLQETFPAPKTPAPSCAKVICDNCCACSKEEETPVMTTREEKQKACTDAYMKYQVERDRKAPSCNKITCKCEQCQEENKLTLHFEGQGHDIIRIPEHLLEQIMDNIKYIMDNMTEEEYDEDGLTGCNVGISVNGKNFMLVDDWEEYDIEN